MVGLDIEPLNETERKRRYAFQIMMEPDNIYAAGIKAYPEETPYSQAMCMKVSMDWKTDPEVLRLKKELIEEHGEAFFLPTKGDVAREIYKTATQAKTAADKLKGLELYANLMSFIEKPPVAQITNTQNNTTNKVMVVPKSNSDDEWEQRLINQQAKLIENAE